MQFRDGQLALSPSDLSNHLACTHLTALQVRAARGELVKPVLDTPHRDLIFRKGNEHEAAYLERLRAEGRTIVELLTPDDEGFDPAVAARVTEEAIRAGEADVIYQPYLVSEDGTWRGFADFLERGGAGYEPVDTKLARSAKPAHVLQLLFYAEQVERIQGAPVEWVHVENGRGERESFRVAEYDAYYRRVRERFLEALDRIGPGTPGPYEGGAEDGGPDMSGSYETAAGEVDAQDGGPDVSGSHAGGAKDLGPGTYPWPCDHCGICDFRHLCWQQRVDDDHLTLVAGMRRTWAERLMASGVTTLAQLGRLAPGTSVDGLRREALEGVGQQASLQLRGREESRMLWELLPDEPDRGFRLLPPPDEGDVWFDMEGHPFYEPAQGLEYLFGYCYRDDAGEVVYDAVWGTDRDSERAAFERFVDWVAARRLRHPGLHVYHYAAYERTALTRLMGQHGTREQEVDDFLREEVLVDLYRVVKQALRASVDSYSIKAIEKLYGFERTAEVGGGDESVVRFEEWIETGDDALLTEVERYNEEDCRSTYELHAWLLEQRPDGLEWRVPPDPFEPSDEAMAAAEERAVLAAALLDGADEGEPRWLLAQLLDYHRREAKPQWWEWFLHVSLDEEELIADTDTIGGLELVGDPVRDGASLVYTLRFPPQDHKLGSSAVDLATEKAYPIRVDDEAGVLELRRGADRADQPLPRALIPGKPITDKEQRAAVARVAASYLAGDGRYPAVVDVLERRVPDVRLDVDDPVDAALSLGRSALFVQGPPGSGKTWHGARMAVALMREGHRVGITSLSHKAIHNLLDAIEAEARRSGFSFNGRKKSTQGDPDTRYTSRSGAIDSSDDWRALLDPELQLLAGTSWLFAREDFDGHLHTLFVDEAGQVSLADALAVGTAAERLVLLGDPNQLPQVSQGAQPEQAKVSVLQHLLGDHQTVPPDRGLFLAETWRLRPELCSFTSAAYYEGRLDHAPVCEVRTLHAGNGPRVLLVEHDGCAQLSWQEADAIAAAVGELLGTRFVDGDGRERPLAESDVLVVAPYNAQVRALRAKLPAGVRVGTVDKFQGQQAPVVFVSMASSTGEDAPRGIGFAFDRHRFNVATSRAQCRAVLACAPRLLDADCKTIEQMRLVSAVCRFVELSG